jgi:hypothetical protein
MTPNTSYADNVWERDLPWKLKFVLLAVATLKDRHQAGVEGDWEAQFTQMTGMTEAQRRPLIRQAIRDGHLELDKSGQGCQPQYPGDEPPRRGHLHLVLPPEGQAS